LLVPALPFPTFIHPPPIHPSPSSTFLPLETLLAPVPPCPAPLPFFLPSLPGPIPNPSCRCHSLQTVRWKTATAVWNATVDLRGSGGAAKRLGNPAWQSYPGGAPAGLPAPPGSPNLEGSDASRSRRGMCQRRSCFHVCLYGCKFALDLGLMAWWCFSFLFPKRPHLCSSMNRTW
jgi:hypothetical protein